MWGKFFHDSNLAITLTDAMFNFEYIAASLGVNIESGGLSVIEEEVTVSGGGGNVELTETPVMFDGTLIGWYKKPADSDWMIGTISGNTMTIPGSQSNDHYCVKYFYQNENAKSIKIKTQYVPSELHVVILNDLYSGDINVQTDQIRYGRLITDVPRLQMDGNQNLALTSTGAATVSLTGSALAINDETSCEEDPYYGTMTEEIYNAKWQDDVIGIAVENGDVELSQNGTETLSVRVIYKGSLPAQRKDNSNFTFAIESDPASTAAGTAVGAHDGKITAGSTAGTAIVSVNLTDYTGKVEPAFVKVTVE